MAGRRGWSGSALLLLIAAQPLHAQGCNEPGTSPIFYPACPDQRSAVESHALSLGINTGLGAVTAGVRAALAGRPFWKAFTRGALGGAVAYGGKRIIGTKEPAVGLLGRQVAAVGASIVSNAADGRSFLGRVALPVGPLRVHLTVPGESADPVVRVKLDLASTIAMSYFALRSDMRFDASASLATGTPVFREPYNGLRGGRHVAGVISISEHMVGSNRHLAIAHELIHASQYDFASALWAEPIERAAFQKTAVGRVLHRHADFGLVLPLHVLAGLALSREDYPWEREALLLTGDTHPRLARCWCRID